MKENSSAFVRKHILIAVAFVAAAVYSCIEPFTPPEINSAENHLVVDGFLNVGNDTSRFELRRSQNVNAIGGPEIETNAALTVEEENGEFYDFIEKGSGLYVLPPQLFNRTSKYRLRIKTRDGQEYLSEYVDVTITPEIDSIGFKHDPARDAATFYINTHDDQNRTQFYRWKFDETWEYRTAYASALEYVNDTLKMRKEDISKCWGRRNSASILLGSTIKLNSDIIKNQPLYLVPVSTNKLFFKYSILVKQYGLSRPAFEYWTSLAKTTQGTGSLFDAQPSQVTGNISNIADPKTLVFGYFSASTEESKRLTISPKLGRFPRCMDPDTIPIACAPGIECAKTTSSLLLSYFGIRADSVLVAPATCADCRLEGGNIIPPSYW